MYLFWTILKFWSWMFTRIKLILVVSLIMVVLQCCLLLLRYHGSPIILLPWFPEGLKKIQNSTFFHRTWRANHKGFLYGEDSTQTPLPLCPSFSPNLNGTAHVTTEILSWASLEAKYSWLQSGGRYRPAHCHTQNRVALIIPYRDRNIHLKIFLNNIHTFLKRQHINYGIYLVELVPGVRFNRAMLFNIGFVEASKLDDYQCFIFHDVDLIPENDHNRYTCSEAHPRHMSSAIDRLHYRLPYKQIFGGACAMTRRQFKKVNGFSNMYFGWGGEDDDMYNRIKRSNMTIVRYLSDVSRYKMMAHKKDSPNPDRLKYLHTGGVRMSKDGLNSLRYDVVRVELKRLYTRILVNINEKDIVGR